MTGTINAGMFIIKKDEDYSTVKGRSVVIEALIDNEHDLRLCATDDDGTTYDIYVQPELLMVLINIAMKEHYVETLSAKIRESPQEAVDELPTTLSGMMKRNVAKSMAV